MTSARELCTGVARTGNAVAAWDDRRRSIASARELCAGAARAVADAPAPDDAGCSAAASTSGACAPLFSTAAVSETVSPRAARLL